MACGAWLVVHGVTLQDADLWRIVTVTGPGQLNQLDQFTGPGHHGLLMSK
jgi:hypothetical protein